MKVGDWLVVANIIVLSTLAIFQDRIRAFVARPRFRVHAKMEQPWAHKTFWNHFGERWDEVHGVMVKTIDKVPCYYIRLLIENYGNSDAREVEVYAEWLEQLGENHLYERVPRFTPMNLLWAHEHKVYMPLLSPKVSKYCDLGHILLPAARRAEGYDLPGVEADSTILALDMQSEPEMKGHLVGPGSYRMGLVVSAANSTSRKAQLEFTLEGRWHDSENMMFLRGMSIRSI